MSAGLNKNDESESDNDDDDDDDDANVRSRRSKERKTNQQKRKQKLRKLEVSSYGFLYFDPFLINLFDNDSSAVKLILSYKETRTQLLNTYFKNVLILDTGFYLKRSTHLYFIYISTQILINIFLFARKKNGLTLKWKTLESMKYSGI